MNPSAPNHDKKNVVYHTCPLCEATCGLSFTVEDNRVVDIRGDKEDVFSKGYLCPKGAALAELHNDPDRLRTPLVRKGDRWETVSWDDAFAAVEKGLLPVVERHGRDAVAVFLGNPNAHTMAGATCMRPLLKALNSRNVFSASSVDQIPKHAAVGLMFGNPTAIPVPDLDRTDYLLMLGANPLASNGSVCTAPDFPGRLRNIQARGGRIVVVDPCRTRTAKTADEHLFIRPGTDPFFLLALVQTLFAENRVSLGHLEKRVEGVDAVRELANDFSPEAVAPVCLVEARTIRRIARELASAGKAAVYGRMGISTVAYGTLATWLVDVLNVLTGNLDREGGAMFPKPAHEMADTAKKGKGFRIGRWKSRVKGMPELIGEFPVVTLADEIETPGEGQVRALMTIAGNPVLSTPNSRRLDAALASLDFMVSVDFYRNETTRHAHVILPPASPLAHSQYDFFFYGLSVRNVANFSPPVVEQEAGEMDKWRIMLRLAAIAGGMGASTDPQAMDDLLIHFLIQSETARPESSISDRTLPEILELLGEARGPERTLDFLLRTGPYGDGFKTGTEGLSLQRLRENPHGIDLGPLKPRLPEILKTASGRIELAPGPILADAERLKSRFGGPAEKELLLVGRRHLRSNNSWMHNVEKLVKGKRRCTLTIHPEDAAARGLRDDRQARIASRVGQLTVDVEISEDIMPGVVSLPHGWGHDLPGTSMRVARKDPGVNSNVLSDEEQIDVLSGNAVLNGIAVTVDPLPQS